jgi:hypothetical protein
MFLQTVINEGLWALLCSLLSEAMIRLTRYDIVPEDADECVTVRPRVLVPEAQSVQ